MSKLLLHEFHARLGAQFRDLNGEEVVAGYRDGPLEYRALVESAGMLDLSSRGRLCLTGTDRTRFLHGQVTNDINRLQSGEGCYAALISAKGKMISDLNIYQLANELLLDFEPGLVQSVQARLEHYIIADDVQVIDVAPQYGLLSVQGPKAVDVVQKFGLGIELPSQPLRFVSSQHLDWGELYVVNQPRLGTSGFDLFIPNGAVEKAAEAFTSSAPAAGGRWCGWDALETARLEAAIPRFGADMDQQNLPPEAGLEARAISYSKGCYIGQEVLSRIRTYGQVAKTLRLLRLKDCLPALPAKGDKLFKDGKELGYITSAVFSPRHQSPIALGYVRRETNSLGTELTLQTESGPRTALVVGLPFAFGRAEQEAC